LDIAAYRILQEAITNVIRHAGPSRTLIGVHYRERELLISVADDGRGPKAGTYGSGRGIAGMRERCELLGGTLTAGPRPGGGFAVQAALPLRPELVPA
jgi:signal transduction histidine kinase